MTIRQAILTPLEASSKTAILRRMLDAIARRTQAESTAFWNHTDASGKADTTSFDGIL